MDVSNKYRVDKDRIYGTGQSQGGMANIAISDAYPELFAGQYLVACQWDTQEMEKLKDKNLWITVCQGDSKRKRSYRSGWPLPPASLRYPSLRDVHHARDALLSGRVRGLHYGYGVL